VTAATPIVKEMAPMLKMVSRNPMASGNEDAHSTEGINAERCPDSATLSGAEPLNPPCQTSMPA
jgi:hypothetical protein